MRALSALTLPVVLFFESFVFSMMFSPFFSFSM